MALSTKKERTEREIRKVYDDLFSLDPPIRFCPTQSHPVSYDY